MASDVLFVFCCCFFFGSTRFCDTAEWKEGEQQQQQPKQKELMNIHEVCVCVCVFSQCDCVVGALATGRPIRRITDRVASMQIRSFAWIVVVDIFLQKEKKNNNNNNNAVKSY